MVIVSKLHRVITFLVIKYDYKPGLLVRCGCVNTTLLMHPIDANKTHGKNATQECYEFFWTNPESNIPPNISCMATYLLSLKLFKLHKDMRVTSREARTNSLMTFFSRLLHMDVPVLANQQKLIYIRFVWTLNTVWKICRERWMIGMDGETERQRERVREICAVSATWW